MNTTSTNNENRTEVQALVHARVNWKEVILFVVLAYGLGMERLLSPPLPWRPAHPIHDVY